MSNEEFVVLKKLFENDLPCSVCAKRHRNCAFSLRDGTVCIVLTTSYSSYNSVLAKKDQVYCWGCLPPLLCTHTYSAPFDREAFLDVVHKFLMKLKNNNDFIWSDAWCTHDTSEEACCACSGGDGWPAVHHLSQLENPEFCANNLLDLTLNVGQWPSAEPEMFAVVDFFRFRRLNVSSNVPAVYDASEMRRLFTDVVRDEIALLTQKKKNEFISLLFRSSLLS